MRGNARALRAAQLSAEECPTDIPGLGPLPACSIYLPRLNKKPQN